MPCWTISIGSLAGFFDSPNTRQGMVKQFLPILALQPYSLRAQIGKNLALAIFQNRQKPRTCPKNQATSVSAGMVTLSCMTTQLAGRVAVVANRLTACSRCFSRNRASTTTGRWPTMTAPVFGRSIRHAQWGTDHSYRKVCPKVPKCSIRRM